MSLSTRFVNSRDANNPILRHERCLAEDLNLFEESAGAAFTDLAGAGRTTETVKGNADNIAFLTAGLYYDVEYEVTEGAASIKIFDEDAPFKFEVVGVSVQCRKASTNGTIKITNGTNDITDAMVCAADKTMVSAATIDAAYSTILVEGTLEIVCSGDTVANTQGLVTILVRPRA